MTARALALVAAAVLLAGCGPAPAPPVEQAKPKPDPTKESWYPETTAQLATLNRDAERLVRAREFDRAGALVTKGQGLAERLLAAPQPTLEAMEAVSDLDDLYGQMLMRNQRYEWARTFFQKNVVRWKNWRPATAETARRLKAAQAALAECDRQMR